MACAESRLIAGSHPCWRCHTLPIEIEVVLRVPNIKNRALGKDGYSIDNGAVRYIKRISVDTMPQVGDSIPLTTLHQYEFEGSVTRIGWHEESSMFKVYCQYGKRRIPEQQYEALLADPEWKMTPL